MVNDDCRGYRKAGMQNARTKIFFLSKFFSEEKHAEQFVRGRLYANRLGYFRELESDSVRADAYEGVSLLRGDVSLAATIDGLRTERITIPEHELAGPSEVRMDWTEHVNLICMHAAHSGSHVEISDLQVDEFKKQHIDIPEDCLKFGDHAVLITNYLQFVKRVTSAVKENKHYSLVGGLVRYSDYPAIDITGVDVVFCKRERFKSEREYRFAIRTGSDVHDPLILETGDLSDIAIRCSSAEINDLIRQMTFRSGGWKVGRAGGSSGVGVLEGG